MSGRPGSPTRLAARFGIRQLVKLVPVYGQTVGAAAAAASSFATTCALGWAGLEFLRRRQRHGGCKRRRCRLPRRPGQTFDLVKARAFSVGEPTPRPPSERVMMRDARLKSWIGAAAIGLAALLPLLVLLPLGWIWLWQHGLALYWLAGALVVSLLVYGGRLWLLRR
ncbi:MAG: hypothetical protein R3D67_03410 [Hyphomicrobiaceae bacterium]